MLELAKGLGSGRGAILMTSPSRVSFGTASTLARVIGIDDVAIDRGEQRAIRDLLLEFVLLALLQLQGRLPGQLVSMGLLDLALKFLDRLVVGVVHQHMPTTHRLLQRPSFAIATQLGLLEAI